ncbi:hypothetical protein BACCAP_04629 [Pseudoflavonifractor capillosus ATCC 29799]|uniref:Uncharacterized protein n=1 Tax=Pseudoflavonifractor capillosus ATCC 29799 TaxID=411467 RepID=A6P2A0_9FIRM|nr:hypothetical protein BACCAP_04629 [Pseudoflavonifractor capillosus ATCC 29799]
MLLPYSLAATDIITNTSIDHGNGFDTFLSVIGLYFIALLE